MQPVKKHLLIAAVAILAPQLALSESLVDIYESALTNDPVLKAARASFNADREIKNIARAALLPQISASGDYSETETTDDSRTTFNIEGQILSSVSKGDVESEGTSYSISLRQAIFDMPSWYNFKSGKALSESASAQFAADQQSLIIRVSDAYFNVLRAYDNMQTREAEERAIQRQLEQTRERFEVGLLPVTDVHEAQAVFDDAAVNSLEARGTLNIAFQQLQVLTGQDYDVLAGLADNFVATNPDPLSDAEWVDFAVGNNYQLKVAELGKDAAYNNAKAAAAARLPKITGRYSYFDSESDGTRYTSPFENQQDGNSVTVSLTMPIWLGGSLDAQRRQAKQQAINGD